MDDSAVSARLGQRPGGRLQQSRLTAKSAPSSLAAKLVDLWAWGAISPHVLQQIAAAAMTDGLHHPSVVRMANLGTSGLHTGNIRRDLLRLQLPAQHPEPLKVRVPYIDIKGNSEVHLFCDGHVCMPNELFDMMYRKHRKFFDEKILGEGPGRFWDQVCDDDPRLQGPSLVHVPDWKDRAVPLTVFGDGVSFTRAGNSLHCLCWGSMLGSGWSKDSLFLAACWPKGACAVRATHGVATLDVFWSWLRLGFDALFHGRHPSTDPDGSKLKSPLAGKSVADGEYFGVVWGIAADLEYAANQLGLPHWNSRAPCGWCGGLRNSGPLNIRNMSGAAGWRCTVVTPERPRPLPDRVIWLIICVTLFHYPGDWMHTVDLGVSTYAHCSVIHELMADDGPFSGITEWKQRLNSVWLAILRA